MFRFRVKPNVVYSTSKNEHFSFQLWLIWHAQFPNIYNIIIEMFMHLTKQAL